MKTQMIVKSQGLYYRGRFRLCLMSFRPFFIPVIAVKGLRKAYYSTMTCRFKRNRILIYSTQIWNLYNLPVKLVYYTIVIEPFYFEFTSPLIFWQSQDLNTLMFQRGAMDCNAYLAKNKFIHFFYHRAEEACPKARRLRISVISKLYPFWFFEDISPPEFVVVTNPNSA
jgi:hypothetical protein